MDLSLTASFVHGILQARILEWVPRAFLPTQGSKAHLPHLLHWQVGSLPPFWGYIIPSFPVPYFLRDTCIYVHTCDTYDYKNTFGTHKMTECSQVPQSETSLTWTSSISSLVYFNMPGYSGPQGNGFTNITLTVNSPFPRQRHRNSDPTSPAFIDDCLRWHLLESTWRSTT